MVATAALLQAVWSRCGGFTPFKAAKRHTWTPKKRVCRHRWWPQQRVCKLCGAAAEGLHFGRRPNGTLEPPRKESGGTGGGHSSAFASCVEPLRTVYIFRAAAKRHTWTPKKRVCRHRWWPQQRFCKLCGAAAEGLHLLRRPRHTWTPKKRVCRHRWWPFASCVEPLWGFTSFRAAKRHTWAAKKRVCRHRWWPGQRVCKLCGAAAEGLHLLGRPNGTLEPPRKESAGTGGGQGSAFASCVEPLRRVCTF